MLQKVTCMNEASTQTTASEDHHAEVMFFCHLRRFGVEVFDFGMSWRSGLAFLAMIKFINPDLVDLRDGFSREPRDNIQLAFTIAHQSLDVPPLLEPEGKNIQTESVSRCSTEVFLQYKHLEAHCCVMISKGFRRKLVPLQTKSEVRLAKMLMCENVFFFPQMCPAHRQMSCPSSLMCRCSSGTVQPEMRSIWLDCLFLANS